ncbi:class I SAM-dependent methyltransferase [Nocardioides flavescens]|uniref:class I SAM-dependent methyltransferase n=1 Tax=Nocardioides flavescens TaxID=2691959 RepID=UPI00301CADEE
MVDDDLWARRSSAFGAAAREYAEHRPGYAPAALDWLLEGAGRDVHDVLDLAAGTGKLCGALDPAMLAELGRRVPSARRLVGRAEAVPLADDSVDVVAVGTAWHWFDTDRARAEVRRVLRPGGVLGLVYALDRTDVPWVAEVGRLALTSVSTTPPDPDAPFDLTGWEGWELEERRFDHVHRRTADSLTAMFGTQSHTMVVSPEERAETLARVRAFLASQPETAEGEFDLPMQTWVARLRPPG